jgi:hypothetical protein
VSRVAQRGGGVGYYVGLLLLPGSLGDDGYPRGDIRYRYQILACCVCFSEIKIFAEPNKFSANDLFAILSLYVRLFRSLRHLSSDTILIHRLFKQCSFSEYLSHLHSL